ncbi:MAG: flagellar FlbD family protein [Acetobacteraceae bacterium]|nr:flagellar FlbD family protein [Acetobacteraceae bacterium]
MILLTRMLSSRTAPVYLNPALIEYVGVPLREDRTGRPVVEPGSEIRTVSGETLRVVETPDEVVRIVGTGPMLHPA